ncbi:hypothetical protein EDB83DRAFT_2237584 [Lactarius deliciosus]|nr:hypothetical protein EDB83DRAFT_2237584 [Lactarius deliciosus]
MVLAAILTFSVWWIVYNLYLHLLFHFPGSKLAACSRPWLACRELVRGDSLGDLRMELHMQIFPWYTSFFRRIVRLTPNELHFSTPAAYNDIYNRRNKWDKDHLLYRPFDLDMSTIGFIH